MGGMQGAPPLGAGGSGRVPGRPRGRQRAAAGCLRGARHRHERWAWPRAAGGFQPASAAPAAQVRAPGRVLARVRAQRRPLRAAEPGGRDVSHPAVAWSVPPVADDAARHHVVRVPRGAVDGHGRHPHSGVDRPPSLTQEFRREGALFWPDLWGMECPDWGQTAWAGHVAWHLLGMRHDASDVHCTQEHEAGHLLIDRERHWRPLCLANYLASRDFFTRVLWGYKDVFRLAWLKLGASSWYSPVRPGLVGVVTDDGRFFGTILAHFWPAGGAFGEGAPGRPVPLYLHQKKVPGRMWHDIVTFDVPLGGCPDYRGGKPFYAEEHGARLWSIQETDAALAEQLALLDAAWDLFFSSALRAFEQDPRMSEADVARLHRKRSRQANSEWSQEVRACRCDYRNNRWFALITATAATSSDNMEVMTEEDCRSVAGLEGPQAVPPAEDCAVGHLTLALGCSQSFLARGLLPEARRAAAAVARLLPEVSPCLPHSFWPLEAGELEAFVRRSTAHPTPAAPDLAYGGSRELPLQMLSRFPLAYQRCVSCQT
ncbi:unnamed protein product [Prorocentrum cordatum]|uniref:Uncharacterized protein n=1 Tax=Prorocentrum cordatum TaxID=2364126 RepID=A0ABN9TLU3_9DINO|nr:unnamed protein product [Polarella glacialis]